MRHLLLIFLLIQFSAQAQETSWESTQAVRKWIVANAGQYDREERPETGPVRFVAELPGMRVFFGERGIRYAFHEIRKVPKEIRADVQAGLDTTVLVYKQRERLMGKFLHRNDEFTMTWNSVNGEMELIGEGLLPGYANYGGMLDSNGNDVVFTEVQAFERVIYRNLQNGIDVVFTLHPEIGLKYALEVAPGADVAGLKMSYDVPVSLENGKLKITTLFGDFIEESPVSFYGDAAGGAINSAFVQTGPNTIRFGLDTYDNGRPVIVDPWQYTVFGGGTQPNYLLDWDVVWELDVDQAGNVYTIGGIDNLTLAKYNSAGVFQWQFNTLYDTTAWLGTLSVDNVGNSYVTNGSTARILKVSTLGAQQWSNNNPNGCFICTDEFWSISFNCDQTRLVVGGTGGGTFSLRGYMYNINVSNGAVTSAQEIAAGAMFSIPTSIQEVRAITSGFNNKYYFVTLDTIGYMNDNFSLCTSGMTSIYKTDHGAALNYKCENFRYNNTGIRAIRANQNYVYTVFGNILQRRNPTTLAVINQVAIPSGAVGTFLSHRAVHNSGIDLDQCGNVYVGSTNGVYKFNADLSTPGGTNFVATPYRVYDVRVNANGEVVACGGNGTGSDPFGSVRNGFVGSYSFTGVCAPLVDACNLCNTNFCVPVSICQYDAPVALVPAVAGGTFSGPGIVGGAIFDPNLAGVGTHIITYTLACGSSTQVITVVPCNLPLTVCEELNGTLTVSGGVGPYAWYTGTSTTTTTNITNASSCTACGGTPVLTFGIFYSSCQSGGSTITSCSQTNFSWNGTPYYTGVNSPAPSSYPIRIIDGNGDILVINNASALQPCGNIPLAVTMHGFEAECQGNSVSCTWTTESEMETEGFILERGNAQGVFEEIAFFPSKGGPYTGHHYSFEDVRSERDLAYYRLFERTTNGQKLLLDQLHINCANDEILVYPNPFSHAITVQLGDFAKGGNAKVYLINNQGKIVYAAAIDPSQKDLTLSVPELAAGMYTLSLRSDNLTHNVRLVKD